MGSTVTDRIAGVSTSVAIKAPVKTITQSNISLSGLGVQAGGSWTEALTAGDRVLVKDQTDAKENGVYTAFTSEWRRAYDFNGYRDVVKGTSVPLESTGDRYRVISDNPIVIGTAEINFQLHPQDARVIPVTSRTAMKAYDVPSGTEFSFDGYPWLVVGGSAPSSDPLEGKYINLNNGNHAVRQYGQAVTVKPAVKPEWWGAKGDGITADTAAIAAANDLRGSGGTIEFNGASTYLIDGSAGTTDSVYGVVVCQISGEDNPRLVGNGCTIKVVSHDLTGGTGLRFANFEACQRPEVSGFNFEMTFTGVNTSSSKYPWCGAVTFYDEPTGAKTTSQLNNDVVMKDCTFNLFHPYGAFATSGAAYAGDPNNGYKLFSAFASGDNQASEFDNQNQNCRFENLTFKKGHNGYGPWVWAYNNAHFVNPIAEDWVSKYSDNTGAFAGSVIPFIRYHQFYCKNVYVTNIKFRAKPCSERTTSGYEGSANAIGFNTNLSAAGLSGGDMVVSGGSIIAGNGDAANSAGDTLIFCNGYGSLVIGGGLSISGISDSTNAESGAVIQYSAESSGGTGFGQVVIGHVSIGENLDYYDNIQILNGASLAGDRRCQYLEVSDVSSLSQYQYFLDTDGGSAATSRGIPKIKLGSVTVDGTGNTVFGPASTNSRAFRFSGPSTDIITGDDVSVDGKYYEFITTNLDSGAILRFNNYRSSGSTLRVTGSKVPVMSLIGSGTPESAEIAGIGSTFQREDGGAGTTFYVKETGTGNTGWVGK